MIFDIFKTHAKKCFVLLSFTSLSISCTPAFQGEYSDPNAVEVVDDRWNETDARKSSEVLVNSMLKKAWLNNYKRANSGQKPVVVVGEMENRTDEHIDLESLIEATQDELINSGMVRFVNKKQREKILEEVKYQNESGNVSRNSRTKTGRQTGADFLLTGAVSSQVHTQGGLKTITYQVVMKLTNLETTEIEWSQKEHIKKRFNRSGSKW